MTHVTLVRSTARDWDAVYINGFLKAEDHRITATDLMDILVAAATEALSYGDEPEFDFSTFDVKSDWLELKALPASLGAIPEEERVR